MAATLLVGAFWLLVYPPQAPLDVPIEIQIVQLEHTIVAQEQQATQSIFATSTAHAENLLATGTAIAYQAYRAELQSTLDVLSTRAGVNAEDEIATLQSQADSTLTAIVAAPTVRSSETPPPAHNLQGTIAALHLTLTAPPPVDNINIPPEQDAGTLRNLVEKEVFWGAVGAILTFFGLILMVMQLRKRT